MADSLENITQDTRLWTPDLDIILPVDGSDIPYFKDWVNWSGWKGYDDDHKAYDFSAYLTHDDKVVLGLPKKTPVRAVADGIVKQISDGLAEGVPYACFLNLEHGREGSGLFTQYHHIVPVVEEGQRVKKGDIIATLYKDPGDEEGQLVHLHFQMWHGWNTGNRMCNPEDIYPSIRKNKAYPQGSSDFRILGFYRKPDIHIANFKRLLTDNV